MRTIIAIMLFVALALWLCRIYFTNDKRFRYVEYNKGEYYLLSRNMYFIIFTVCTAPIFLGSFSMLKYGLWIGLIVWLLLSNKVRMVMEPTMVMYLVFFLWLVYAATYSPVPRDAIMMLAKYALPLCFLWLGYSAMNSEKDLIIFFKCINVVAVIYCFTIGGMGHRIIPLGIYYGPFLGQFALYAPFADYLVAVFIVPIILYWLTKENKYIYCALFMVLSTVLESVRTGMGGMMLVFVFAILLRYKMRAVPGVLFAGAIFVSVILFVPEVNEKFFGEDSGVTATDIVQGDALSMDNMNTNGRSDTWELILDKFYKGHEMRGSGLGVAIRYLKDLWANGFIGAGLIHNDYVQLLSEAGIIGVSLLVLFYIAVVVKVVQYVVLQRSNYMVKMTGIMALSSMAGIAFCMYFDNVVSNSMQSMIIPYIYLGFFLKMVDKEKKGREQEKINKFRDAIQ